MVLQTCCGSSAELGLSAQACMPSSSPSKLQTLCSPFNSKLFLGFNSCGNRFALSNFYNYTKISHPHKKRPNRDGFFVGCTLSCPPKIVPLPKKNVNKGKHKKYGGILPSILRDLEVDKDVEKTLDLYHGKLSPKEQTVILKEQRNWFMVVRVFEWFKSQKDYVPNVIHYNIVLRALGRARRWDELRLCWIEMANRGVLPANHTYGILIDVYGKAGLVREALLWIKHMKLRGIFPDEVTMSTVVKALKDAGEYDRADRFYKDWCLGKIELDGLNLDDTGDEQAISLRQFLLSELFRTGVRSHSSSEFGDAEVSVKKPRLTSTYNALIDLYGKAGRLKDAADVFADMLSAGVALDTFTFNTMIHICGSHGYLSEAEALLDEMEQRGITPDTKTYNIFLSLYANVGNVDAVIQCYEKIRKVGLFPDDVTYRVILKLLGERNMVQEVEVVIQDMEKFKKHMDGSFLPLLTKMYVTAGLSERASFLLEKCQSHGRFRSSTCAAIMDVYAEYGLWADAEALFYNKRDGHEQKKDVLEYNVMIKVYGKAKLYDKALSLFKGMRNQGMWPDACTYNSLIQMCAGDDLVDNARDLLAEMQEAGFKPSCSTFSAVIAGFAKKKRLPDAVDVFQEMLKTDVKPKEIVYGSLIDAFAEDGNFEEAKHYFDIMEESGISANKIILTSMIKAYGKIGYVEGAKQMYEKMKTLDGGLDIVASNSMLNLYADLGMVYEAKVLFHHLKAQDLANAVTFATMMYAYKNMGMLNESIEVARDMKQSGLMTDSVAYNKVMECYAIIGQLVECGELLHEMIVNQKLLPDHGTYKILFSILKKGGILPEAFTQLESSYKEEKPYAKQAVIISFYTIVGLHAYALELCGTFTKEVVGFSSVACNAAIFAFQACGKIDEALNMLMRMQDKGLEPDIVTLIYLVNCYAKARMIEGLNRIHSQLEYDEIEPSESLYMSLKDAYENVNRPDLAELVTQEMKFASDGELGADSDIEFMTDSETEDPGLITIM